MNTTRGQLGCCHRAADLPIDHGEDYEPLVIAVDGVGLTALDLLTPRWARCRLVGVVGGHRRAHLGSVVSTGQRQTVGRRARRTENI